MEMIKILDKLHETGELRDLVLSGLISPNVLIQRKIFHAYNLQIDNGVSKMQSVVDVSTVFCVSERMVYRVLKRFK